MLNRKLLLILWRVHLWPPFSGPKFETTEKKFLNQVFSFGDADGTVSKSSFTIRGDFECVLMMSSWRPIAT